MGITINGSSAAGNIDLGTNGTIADLAVGGIPDGTIDSDAIAANAVTGNKIAMGSDAAGDILYYNGTDYIRLAKGTDGQVLILASGVPTWADAPAGDITDADHWRMTSDTTTGSNTNPLVNWARADETGFAKIGDGISESSGIFSFPSGATGIYWMTWTLRGLCDDDSSMNMVLNITTDNGSNWHETALATIGFNASSGEVGVGGGTGLFLFDVTDVSQCKFKFALTSVGGNSRAYGGTSYSMTYFQVMRIAGT